MIVVIIIMVVIFFFCLARAADNGDKLPGPEKTTQMVEQGQQDDMKDVVKHEK